MSAVEGSARTGAEVDYVNDADADADADVNDEFDAVEEQTEMNVVPVETSAEVAKDSGWRSPVDWRHVYYLVKVREKGEANSEGNNDGDGHADRTNDSEGDGEGDNDGNDDDEDGNNDKDAVEVEATKKEAAKKKKTSSLIFATALREHSGRFVPHPKQMFKLTSSYAKRNTIPVSNLVQFAYRCPFTGEKKIALREYCDKRPYADAFKRVVRDTLRKNPSLGKALNDLDVAQKMRRYPRLHLSADPQQAVTSAVAADTGASSSDAASSTPVTESHSSSAIVSDSSSVTEITPDTAIFAHDNVKMKMEVEVNSAEDGDGAQGKPNANEMSEVEIIQNVELELNAPQLVSALDGVTMLRQPRQLEAKLHEHQVS